MDKTRLTPRGGPVEDGVEIFSETGIVEMAMRIYEHPVPGHAATSRVCS